MPKFRLDASGLTIIELMMVAAIFGILASIGFPEYSKFIGRSRQTEAKSLLGAVLISEKGYLVEHGTYSACIRQMGYAPMGGSGIYYSVGFGNPPVVGCGPDGTMDCMRWYWSAPVVTCASASDIVFSATATSFTGSAIYGADANFEACTAGTTVTKTTFIVGACGNVSRRSTVHDGWTIDENKVFRNPTPGL